MTIYYFSHKDFGLRYFTVGTGKVRMTKLREKALKKYKEVTPLKSTEKGFVEIGGFPIR